MVGTYKFGLALLSNYYAQLQDVVDALRERQSSEAGSHEGGWGALIEPRAASSIVNTAEAVMVFRLAGVAAGDSSLRRGVEYLRSKVLLHPAPSASHPQARGSKTRYCAFGLLGLTAYSWPIEDKAHARALAHCIQWLGRYRLVEEGVTPDEHGAGWSEHPRASEVSVLSTAVASIALDRVPGGIAGAKAGRVLASDARRRLRALARGDVKRACWWPTRANAPDGLDDTAASPALTAYAVLALAEGGPLSQSYARAGARWLIENAERWEQHREPDENVYGANWVYASSPLCVRAVLVPCAGNDPDDHRLSVAIRYVDELWSPEAKEWLHGHPASLPTTSADYHCAAAIRAVRRSWRGFDPSLHLGSIAGTKRPSPRHMGGDKPHGIEWSDGLLTVRSVDGSTLVEHRFPRRATAMRSLLDALTASWRDAGPEAGQFARSLSATELAEQTQIRDVGTYVARLDEAIRKASIQARGRPCALIHRIESGKGARADRYALYGQVLVDS